MSKTKETLEDVQRKSLFERLRDKGGSLVIMAVLLLLCYNRWKIDSPLNDIIIDFLQYNPNGYRLWTQFLIMLDQHPIAYVALTSIVFAMVSWALYLGCRKEDQMMLFGWLAMVLFFASIRQAPAFLLLALAILVRDVKWSYLMVIPMTLVKEHAGIVYVIYLLSIKRYREAVGVGVLWAVTFLSIRLLIGPLEFWTSPVTGETLYTPILTLMPYIARLTWMKWIWIAAEVMLCVLFLKDRTEVFMVLANLPIITLFGLFYEPQLWLMVMVAIVYKRRVEEDE